MKALLFFLFLIFTLPLLADSAKVELNPAKPVVGEVFRAFFHIYTDSDTEPVINFVPSGVEVVGKSNQGVSTSTVYANGNLTVTREMIYVYELVASRPGSGSLRDINISMNGKVFRHPTVSFSVLKEAEEKSEVFVMADIAKKEVYLGEGILVRYYVYSRAQVNNIELKKFPKLTNFLKRFLQEPENPERVNVDGQVYVRRLVYSSKLFPEKVGELKIDPLYAAVTYAAASPNDPFSSFGFSRDFRTKNLNSEAVTITVKPLPEPIPTGFTGLIGKHEFDLQFGQSKLIVNEPLEIKLTVSGGGMLETFEAPTLIKAQGFEEFETNGDLKIADSNNATKIFDYTYLAKENMKVPAGTVTLSTFDPVSQRYIPTQLNIPELVVAGGSATPKTQSPKEDKKTEVKKDFQIPQMPKDFAGPILDDPTFYRKYLSYFNFFIAGISLLVAFSLVMKKGFLPKFSTDPGVPTHFKKGDFSLSEFTRWLSPLIQKTGKAPLAIIRESALGDPEKAYFIDLLNANDYKDYSSQKGSLKFTYQSGPFKSLGKYIESVKNESSSKPS
jgi:hypothetical protein